METQRFRVKGFVSYFMFAMGRRKDSSLSCFNYDISLKHLEIHTDGHDVAFDKISKEWFDNLKEYFRKAKGLRCAKPLSINSANSYFSIITSVAREAANDGHLNHAIVNALTNLASRTQAKPSALSFEELQALASVSCNPPDLKRAFLFSCLTGIQWKDIELLKWNQLQPNEDDSWKVLINRDDEQVVIPLSTQAREILGLGGYGNKRVFDVHYSAALCVSLNKWALRAGITRNITFHSARQTFGKMLLDQGVELELISELLGHKHLKTTTKFLSVDPGRLPITSNYLRVLSI